MTVLKWFVAVGRFFYGFVVGDDLSVTVVVVIALAITAVLVGGGINAWWLVPPIGVVMTGVALRRRSRAERKLK